MLKRISQGKLGDIAADIRRLAPHLRPYLGRHKMLLVGGVLALLGSTAMRLLEPWPLQIVVDHVIGVQPDAEPATTFLLEWLDRQGDLALLTICAAALVFAVGLRAICEYAATVGFALVGNRALNELRGDLFAKLQRLPLSFHQEARTGDLTVRMVGDIGMMRDVAVTALLPLMTNVLILVGMLAVMLLLNWQLTLIAMLPLPLLFINTVRLGQQIKAVSREQRRREGSIAAALSESLAGIRSVQALSLENRLAGHFAQKNNQSLKAGLKAGRLAASLERRTDLLVGISSALVLWFGTRSVLQGGLTVGELLVFLAYLKSAFKPVRDFAKYSGRLAKATAAAERVVDLLEQEVEIRDKPDARPAPAFTGEILFDGVQFAYRDGTAVLNGVQLAVGAGQLAAFVGPSGAGKSTLASLAMRLYDPRSGRILIDGHDIRDLTLHSLRAQFSAVLQDTLIFSGTVRDNITLTTPDASEADVEAAARLANAHDFIMAMPHGYDTMLSERGASLSNGQRQRLAIARAALRPTPILVLDEPTAALDKESERLVIDAIRRLAEGRTVLLITHDLDLAAAADLVVVVHDGTAEQGRHEELLASNQVYASLHRARQQAPSADNVIPYAVAS